MKKRNLMHRLLLATLLVGVIFLTGGGNDAYASVMGSGNGYTGANSAGGMLGSGTITADPENGDPANGANAVETTSTETGELEEILETLLEFFT